MKKVCYISPLSIHSYRWIEAFSRRGYDVSLIADTHFWVAPKIEFIPTYTLRSLNRTNLMWRLLPNTAKVTTILRQIDPDFVHLHVQHYYMPPIIFNGIPFILSSWGAEVLLLPYSGIFVRGLAKIVANEARAITVDAECLREIWIKLGVMKTKIEVIPFGVDTNIFHPSVSGRLIRRKFEIGEEDIVVISTRPFSNDHYNVECLIRAIPLILRVNEKVKFIIKGSGPLETCLKKLAEELGIGEQVNFIGQLVPHREMAQLLSAADIYVSTCFVDSTSVSLLEAMACKLAPVVTNISGNREWIEDGVNGFLFPPRNHVALAEKVLELADNRKLRNIFGRKCVDMVKERARWEDCVERMATIYETLTKK